MMTVTMDFNHPLAGELMHFEGTVTGVRDASAEEIAALFSGGGCGCGSGGCGDRDVVAVTGQMKVDPAVAVQIPVVAVVQVAVAKGT